MENVPHVLLTAMLKMVMSAKLAPLDVKHVLLMEHVALVLTAIIKTVLPAKLASLGVLNVLLVQSVPNVLLAIPASAVVIQLFASLAVLAALPALLLTERLSHVPHVTLIMLGPLVLRHAQLVSLANTQMLVPLQLAQPVPLDNSIQQLKRNVITAQIPNVRLALVKTLDNAQLATMASILSVELAEARVLPPPKELDQLLEV